MHKHYKLLGGILAVFFYFLLLGLLINYFNHHTKDIPQHYSSDINQSIKVSLVSPLESPKVQKKETKPKKPKKVKKPKKSPKKEKPKPPPPPKVEKKPEVKKPNTNLTNLFNKITGQKPKKKPKKIVETKKIKKAPSQNRGINHAYFANVENMLQNWPSQSEFAGETIKVWLKISRDGSFIFKILSASNNEDFNHSLIQYLKQLQEIGFGSHKNAKPYELNVEFVAKE